MRKHDRQILLGILEIQQLPKVKHTTGSPRKYRRSDNFDCEIYIGCLCLHEEEQDLAIEQEIDNNCEDYYIVD